MIFGLSFVLSFSVLTPFFDAHAGTLGQMFHSFVSKQPFVSKWVAFEKRGFFGMGSFPRLLTQSLCRGTDTSWIGQCLLVVSISPEPLLVCRFWSAESRCITQKKRDVHKISPVILGPEMAMPILWAPGIFWFFLLENPHAHKIPPFREGCWGFLEGGGGSHRKCQFYFYGRGDFSELRSDTKMVSNKFPETILLVLQ